jgi:hypothetical protein
MTLEVRLSTSGFNNIPRYLLGDDFTFVVGSECHKCPLLIACFLSPHISSIVVSDPTVREFHVQTCDIGSHFTEFLSLVYGSSITLTGDNRNFFRSLSSELGNREFVEFVLGDDAAIDNVLDRLEHHLTSQEPYEFAPEIEFCAAHFFELDRSQLIHSSFPVLDAIVSHDSLQVTTEDLLYEIIRDRFCEDFGFSELFQFIQFEYLSIESIRSFCDLINNSFEVLTPGLIYALSHRLSLPVSPIAPNDRVAVQSLHFSFRSGYPLDGVIRYLTRLCNGHVHDCGIVSITESGVHGPDFGSRHIADFDETGTTPFISQDKPQSWVCYDFKTRELKPTHYTVRTRQDQNHHHLRSWVLEGSVDDELWKPLDSRESDATLNGQGAMATFAVTGADFVRKIRLRQVGKNTNNSNHLVMSAFELFGEVRDVKVI